MDATAGQGFGAAAVAQVANFFEQQRKGSRERGGGLMVLGCVASGTAGMGKLRMGLDKHGLFRNRSDRR